MRNRVERLRIWLLGSAVFLLLVIVAFVGMARYLRHRFLAGVPLQLALNILRETANPEYCQTQGGLTKFCIHAAKSVEYNDGKMKLHDVSITLYGKKGDRSDRIYGDEFEYDKGAGIVRATGLVHIDMQAAGSSAAKPGANAKLMHITTSGLVYLQKLGLASTSEPIEFEAGGIKGHAVGADYSSDSAIMTLHSAVNMSGTEDGHPLALTAATAQFDDRSQQVFLTRATYESDGRKAAGEQATLYRRSDGTLSRIDAKGNVTLQADGSTVVAQHADVLLTAASRPLTALLTGGVKYSSEQPLRQVTGQSEEATIDFDAQVKPQPQRATFLRTVLVTERMRATATTAEPWSTRELKAGRVEVALAPPIAGVVQPRDVAATGSPHLTIVNNGTLESTRDIGTTELSASTLSAHLIAADDPRQPPQVDTIVGRGNTLLRQLTADGKEQTVAADSLDARLRSNSPHASGSSARDKVAEALLSAVQTGHVQMMQRKPAKGSAAATVEHALANRAVYDGDTDRMTLSGGVQMNDADGVLWSNQVVIDRKTSNAYASGAVKGSYTIEENASGAPNLKEPAHVLADRANLDHANGTTTFYGKPVRLWQGGNQILAPLIELSNPQKRLIARGDTAASVAQVRTILAGSASTIAPGQSAAGSSSAPCKAAVSGKADSQIAGLRAANVVQVVSGGLTFLADAGEADFTGGMRAVTTDGTIRAAQGVVYLKETGPPRAKVGAGISSPVTSMSRELDRIVATGHVEFNNPGLKATGERLVYTASDRSALLTGDAKDPPRAVEAQGTTTGSALRLQSSCDGSGGGSVEVLGAPGQRVHTDARIDEEGKREKAKQ